MNNIDFSKTTPNLTIDDIQIGRLFTVYNESLDQTLLLFKVDEKEVHRIVESGVIYYHTTNGVKESKVLTNYRLVDLDIKVRPSFK